MPVKSKDITGNKFGSLTVLNEFKINKNGKTRLYCRCLCDCGNEKDIYKYNLTSGVINNCGCNKKIEKERKIDITNLTQKYKNDFRICENKVLVKLKNTGKEMICDIEDWKVLGKFLWIESYSGYAITRRRENGINKIYFFHRLAMSVFEKEIIDHINQNRLDNRKENLRITSASMNCFNRKCKNEIGYNGVSKLGNKWLSRIMVNHVNVYLGIFDTLEDAIEERKRAEIEYRGEYSKK